MTNKDRRALEVAAAEAARNATRVHISTNSITFRESSVFVVPNVPPYDPAKELEKFRYHLEELLVDFALAREKEIIEEAAAICRKEGKYRRATGSSGVFACFDLEQKILAMLPAGESGEDK